MATTPSPEAPCEWNDCGRPRGDRHTCRDAWRRLKRGTNVIVNGCVVSGDETADDIIERNGRMVRVYCWEVWRHNRQLGIFGTKAEAYRFAKQAGA